MRAPLLAFAVWASLVATAGAVTSFNMSKFEAPSARAGAPLSAGGLLVPLTDAPFQRLVDLHSPVAFDFTGAGERRAQGWLTPNAAWLVSDPLWGGVVSSGADILSFDALRARDLNGDGVLTGMELDGLSLWHDENGDGISEPGEVVPVNVHGIVSISVHGAQTGHDFIEARNGVRFDDGRTRPIYDWLMGAPPPPPHAS